MDFCIVDASADKLGFDNECPVGTQFLQVHYYCKLKRELTHFVAYTLLNTSVESKTSNLWFQVVVFSIISDK